MSHQGVDVHEVLSLDFEYPVLVPPPRSVRDSGSVAVQANSADRYAMQEILPRLWLGPFAAAGEHSKAKLDAAGITHIVVVEPNVRCIWEGQGILYHRVPIHDDGTEELLPHLGACFAFIDAALDSKGAVLIHCLAGMSRSASIVAAYVVRARSLSHTAAVAYVQARRAIVSPNPGFLAQLSNLEVYLQEAGNTPSRD